MTQWYRIGTCSVASGSKTVTFSIGVTLLNNAKAADGLVIGTGTNQPVEIGSITDNTHCELVNNWPYATVTASVYAIIPGPNWDDRTALALDVATYLAAVSGVTQSSTTLTIGTGHQTLQIPHSTRLSPGAFVTISDTAAPTTRYMAGIVTAYIGSALTVNVTAVEGSGSGSSWNVNVGGAPGATGSTGATGATGATGPQGPAGTGDVTAASNFGTDNRLIRSDGTGKGVKASSVSVDASGHVSTPYGGWFKAFNGGAARSTAIAFGDSVTGGVADFGIGMADTTGEGMVEYNGGATLADYFGHRFLNGNAQVMRIANGRVTIGPGAGTAKLSVKDAAAYQGLFYGYQGASASDANGEIRLGNVSAYQARIGYEGATTGDVIIDNTYAGKIRFRTNTSGTPVDALTITGTGVGIGIAAPTYQLQLSTDSAAKPGTNTWTIASDERLKQNIVAANLERCWEIVKTVPLKRYTWKEETYTADQVADRSKLGWIAQDVKPAFKNAVTPFKFTKAVEVPDGVEEYQEQKTVAREVTREVTEIEIRNGVPVQVAKTITETVNEPVFDAVAVVDEAGAPVLDAEGNPVTHPVPRMITKTRPKFTRETIDDCLSLNTDQIYAAMYGALQLAMSKIEALEAEVATLKSAP